jgi:hypothetical protein
MAPTTILEESEGEWAKDFCYATLVSTVRRCRFPLLPNTRKRRTVLPTSNRVRAETLSPGFLFRHRKAPSYVKLAGIGERRALRARTGVFLVRRIWERACSARGFCEASRVGK